MVYFSVYIMEVNKTARIIRSEIINPVMGFSAVFLGAVIVLTYRLRYLLPGFSLQEKAAITSSSTLNNILTDPLYAPHKIFQYLMSKLAHTGFIAMRSISVLMGLAVVYLFFYAVRKWFSFRVSLLATVLLATSGWFVFTARSATTGIMSLSLIGVVAFGSWIIDNRFHRTLLIAGFGLALWLLYVPGLIWFVIFGFIVQRAKIREAVNKNRGLTIVLTLGLLILLAPLVYNFVQNPHLLQSYFGLTTRPITNIINFPKNLLNIPLNLFIINKANPLTHVGRMPILDIFTSVMVVLGIYNFFVNERHLDRARFLLGTISLACILIALGGSVGIEILIPFVYLLAASGIAYLMNQWFVVFPSNPIARFSAWTMIILIVSTAAFYNLQSYFVAWAKAPVTKAYYSIQPTKPAPRKINR